MNTTTGKTCVNCEGTGWANTDLSDYPEHVARNIRARWDRDYWSCGEGDPGEECNRCGGTGRIYPPEPLEYRPWTR
jgi:hypothetical protein